MVMGGEGWRKGDLSGEVRLTGQVRRLPGAEEVRFYLSVMRSW